MSVPYRRLLRQIGDGAKSNGQEAASLARHCKSVDFIRGYGILNQEDSARAAPRRPAGREAHNIGEVSKRS